MQPKQVRVRFRQAESEFKRDRSQLHEPEAHLWNRLQQEHKTTIRSAPGSLGCGNTR